MELYYLDKSGSKTLKQEEKFKIIKKKVFM
jgi:hypothetical protein